MTLATELGLGTLPWWAQAGAFGLLALLLGIFLPKLISAIKDGADKIGTSISAQDANHRADRKAQEDRHAGERARDAAERTKLYELLATKRGDNA
jgi:hypothetical protein